MIRIILFSIILTATATPATSAGCPDNSHIKPGTENNARVICNCNDGYENRAGVCRPVPEVRPDTREQQLRRLRDEAASEWYWFTVNQFDVMTGAFWAAYGYEPRGENPDIDSKLREARTHLGNWLDVQRRIEAITHDRATAQQRYEQRIHSFMIARRGNYAISATSDTAKADMYPPTDFSPWVKDEEARKNNRCIFVGRSAELVCK